MTSWCSAPSGRYETKVLYPWETNWARERTLRWVSSAANATNFYLFLEECVATSLVGDYSAVWGDLTPLCEVVSRRDRAKPTTWARPIRDLRAARHRRCGPCVRLRVPSKCW